MLNKKLNIWDSIFTKNDHPVIFNTNKEITEILKFIKNKDNAQVLELGCGYGNDAKILKSKIKKLNLICTDSSKIAIKKCKNEIFGKNIKFVCSPAEKLNFKKDSFDVIFSFLLFHCLKTKQIKIIIKNMAQQLKKDGVFFIKTRSKKDVLSKITAYKKLGFKPLLLNKKELRYLLKKYFKKVEIIEEICPDYSHDKPHTHAFLIAKCKKY